MLRSKLTAIPSVEIPEITGTRAPKGGLPRFTILLVRDYPGSGLPPNSGDDLVETGLSRASDYSLSRSCSYKLSLKVKDLPELTNREDPTFPA